MAEAVEPPFDRPDAQFNLLPGWTWVGCYGGYYLQADLLAGFEHGFFTRQWQGRGPDVLAGYLSAGVSVHRPQQVHSAVVLPASAARSDPWPEADGLVSDAGGQSLWVCGADCTPVLIADPDTGQVAACHAGWRGVAGQILKGAVERLEHQGCQRSALLVALGPAISGARYQVDAPVAEAIAASLGACGDGEWSTRGREPSELDGVLQPDPQPGRWRLDIRAAASLQLQQLGLNPQQLALCPLCTASEPLLFHSWRRDQRKAVQWSGIVSQA
ncbi:MAG: peptidoglycan editing factor PgeF [Cyanobacteriota bacterium]|nr:peptidoglycan editing factor PgeF [Cyanobacteriota bacterium]